MKIVVCMKQVPMVTELPWDAATGTLRRALAGGMTDPASRHAFEAALRMKQERGAHVTALTMGPPQAEEIIRESLALGADRGILLTDPLMAGADTLATSYTLACAVLTVCPDFDLVLCGDQTADSETAQVGPQLAEELDVPGASYVESIEFVSDNKLRLRRVADNFLETLEMDLPGLISVTTRHYTPRHAPLAGIESAFSEYNVEIFNAEAIGAAPTHVGPAGSATKILKVYPSTAEKQNDVLTGAPKRIVEKLFAKYGDHISSLLGRDLTAKTPEGED